jgi:hypothetical protein
MAVPLPQWGAVLVVLEHGNIVTGLVSRPAHSWLQVIQEVPSSAAATTQTLSVSSLCFTRSPVDPQQPRPQQQQAMGVHPQLRVVNQFAIPGSPLGSPVSESMRQGGGMFGLEVPLPRFSHQGMGRTVITGGRQHNGDQYTVSASLYWVGSSNFISHSVRTSEQLARLAEKVCGAGLEVPLPRFSHQGMGRSVITGGRKVRSDHFTVCIRSVTQT